MIGILYGGYGVLGVCKEIMWSQFHTFIENDMFSMHCKGNFFMSLGGKSTNVGVKLQQLGAAQWH